MIFTRDIYTYKYRVKRYIWSFSISLYPSRRWKRQSMKMPAQADSMGPRPIDPASNGSALRLAV